MSNMRADSLLDLGRPERTALDTSSRIRLPDGVLRLCQMIARMFRGYLAETSQPPLCRCVHCVETVGNK